MINELFALSKSLEKMRISTNNWHREYKVLPNPSAKSPCVRIWMSENGEVTGIQKLDIETVNVIRKYGNNQRTFPAFNIKPLYRVTDEKDIKLLRDTKNGTAKINIDGIRLMLVENNWIKSLNRIDEAVKGLCEELKNIISNHVDNCENAVTAIISSIFSMKDGLRSALESYIFSALEDGDDISLLLRLLVHEGNPAKAVETDSGDNISIVLDCDNWRDYGYPIASETITKWINSILLMEEKANERLSNKLEIDAFGYPCSNAHQEPMPKVKLPGFEVTLRSMYSEQQSQKRYGRFADESFYVSKDIRQSTKGALEWISSESNKRKTWIRADKDEIVFVYPSELPQVDLRYASLFGPPSDLETEHLKVRFNNSASDFIKVFDGLSPQQKPANIIIFSIRKMDAARSKVVFTRNLVLDSLVESAKTWQEACSNIPPLFYFRKITPFPLEIAPVINNVWMRDGKRIAMLNNSVKRVQLYQGLELLLDPPKLVETPLSSVTSSLLHVLLTNSETLILFVVNQLHRQKIDISVYAKQVAYIAAVMGLLLYKNGYYKEAYMQDTAFLLGQILKVSDELHAMYCMVKRNGDVPPQLAGSSMFTTATDMPLKALSQLGQRMIPYITWAKQYRTINSEFDGEELENKEKKGIESWRAQWYLSLYTRISDKLHQTLTMENSFNDYEKAQLFLGYLASFPKREAVGNDNDDSRNDTYMEEYANG